MERENLHMAALVRVRKRGGVLLHVLERGLLYSEVCVCVCVRPVETIELAVAIFRGDVRVNFPKISKKLQN